MTALVPIPRDALPQLVGKGVHVAGWRKGCVFVLERLDGETMHLCTPTTGRRFTASADRALYTRKHQPQEASHADR